MSIFFLADLTAFTLLDKELKLMGGSRFVDLLRQYCDVMATVNGTCHTLRSMSFAKICVEGLENFLREGVPKCVGDQMYFHLLQESKLSVALFDIYYHLLWKKLSQVGEIGRIPDRWQDHDVFLDALVKCNSFGDATVFEFFHLL